LRGVLVQEVRKIIEEWLSMGVGVATGKPHR